MASKMVLPLMPLLFVVLPQIQAMETGFYGIVAYTDSKCKRTAAGASNSLSDYKMEQFNEDKHCYFHKGYSIKLTCGGDDTVTVDHWLDLTGKHKPCLGPKLAGEPLMKDVPWEIALDLFNGDCAKSANHGKYGKLTAALPTDGFPKCDFTGASIRRLSSSNATNGTNVTTPAPTPTPPQAPITGISSCKCTGALPASITRSDCSHPFAPTSGKCVDVDAAYGNISWWKTYPDDYGSQCQAHLEPSWAACFNNSEAQLPKVPQELLTPASWCTDKWCYVDPCKCDAPDVVASSAFASHNLGDMMYSYAACGALDQFTATNTGNTVGSGVCAPANTTVNSTNTTNTSAPTPAPAAAPSTGTASGTVRLTLGRGTLAVPALLFAFGFLGQLSV